MYIQSSMPRTSKVRMKLQNDVYFQMNPQAIDAYVETHENIVAKMDYP